jgi:PAS domain S-box-containing protein
VHQSIERLKVALEKYVDRLGDLLIKDGKKNSMRRKDPRPKARRNLPEDSVPRTFDREVGEILIQTTPDNTVLFWNAGAETVYGYTKTEAIGNRLDDLIVPPELIEESKEITRQAIQNGQAVHETIRRRKDGSVIHVDITTKAVLDDKGAGLNSSL